MVCVYLIPAISSKSAVVQQNEYWVWGSASNFGALTCPGLCFRTYQMELLVLL